VDGNKSVSEFPRKHCLSKVDCTESYDRVAQGHKDRGYFLTMELDERGITGIFPGATRSFKLSTYGLSGPQVKYLGEAFLDIARKHGLEVH
jgi:Sep-tRNA:Cys-tRNA synthetase